MYIFHASAHKIDFHVHRNVFTSVDLEIQLYSTKRKRKKGNRQPEQQMAFSIYTSVINIRIPQSFYKTVTKAQNSNTYTYVLNIQSNLVP